MWQTLSQLLCESRGENKALKKDFADLRQLYNDAQEDIQLLRETLANQRKSNNNIKDCKDGIDPRQDLICQLEKSQEKVRWVYLTVNLFSLFMSGRYVGERGPDAQDDKSMWNAVWTSCCNNLHPVRQELTEAYCGDLLLHH